jgi:N-acetylglucosamine-6-phosphate deacetylase
VTTLLSGGRKVDADGEIDGFWVLLDGPAIAATGTGEPPGADEVVDLAGAWLAPGFVDLHCHGGGGFAFDDGPDSIRQALAVHRAHGTTRSVISLVAAPLDRLEASLDGIADLTAADPTVLGAHLEGPFLAEARCGAHDPAYLRPPALPDVQRLLDAARGTLRQVTIAPELPGATQAIRFLRGEGVVVAVGHTEADHQLSVKAFDVGARLLTHAFNAMPGLHHRDPGPLGAALADHLVTIELVLDGHHVHPALAVVLFAAAPDRLALVTDAMAAAGAGDGDYRLGALDVAVRGGVARLGPDGPLAGSTLTQDAALRLAIGPGITPVEAVTALTATPARVLGLDDRLGRLAAGYAADVVVLEPDWTVRHVWADGRQVT